ncbi:YecA family protein [Algiphilus sp.]|uniref:YecA family protein n=1 Tax=Algiphilus sp. TaxID=1872431 RepID=UPI0025C735A0|nr:YecA family protein [Algiphilus sp.]MCK5769324.1 UPF0149 family protein [Algiphilus sp.]
MALKVGYDNLSAALKSAGLTADPAQFHGALCGALCMRGADDIDPLALLAEERGPVDADSGPAAEATLRSLRGEVADELSGGSGLTLILPPDEGVTLEQRTRALAAWCDGFIYGLASTGKLDLDGASEEVREAVSDITQFTRATIEGGDDIETEEGAYAELVEYLRVVVQLIHLECRGAPGEPGAPMH